MPDDPDRPTGLPFEGWIGECGRDGSVGRLQLIDLAVLIGDRLVAIGEGLLELGVPALRVGEPALDVG